jgi:ABC-type phosphate transport system substrate-binding protein
MSRFPQLFRSPHAPLAVALLCLACAAAPSAQADTAVIVNAGNNTPLDDEVIAKIFLRQVKTFPDGSVAAPVNQREGATSDEFRAKILKKNGSQFKAYWAQQLFTGGAKPVQEVEGDDAVLKFVAETPNAIGYVDASKVKGGVKVVTKK